MNRLALYDVETTGLDPAKHVAVEVAIVLYDIPHAAPVAAYSSLLQSDTNEATPINGIPVAMLIDAPAREKVWPRVHGALAQADVICTHNAAFDRSMTPSTVGADRPWVCTMDDVPWPKGKPGSGIVARALAHGVGVASAHRALADVMTMALLMQRVQEMGCDLRAMIERAMRPRVRLIGQQGRHENDLAKAAGFRWNPDERVWWRDMPREDAAALPFRTCEVTT